MTPEGRVKRQIGLLLEEFNLWAFKPVQFGYGKRALDYIICIAGRFLVIEVKRPDMDDITPYQRITAREVYTAGGTVFIIHGPDGIAALRRWLERATDRPHS